MKYILRYFWLGVFLVCFYSCSKDENNNSNNFATGIAMV